MDVVPHNPQDVPQRGHSAARDPRPARVQLRKLCATWRPTSGSIPSDTTRTNGEVRLVKLGTAVIFFLLCVGVCLLVYGAKP